MKKVFLIIPVVLWLFSCSGKKENVTIKGSFREAHPQVIYLKELSKNGVVLLDSSKVGKNGNFILHTTTHQPAFCVLWVENSRGINLLALPNDVITVYINSNQFDIDYTVEGSPESRRISKLIRQQYKTMEQITELSDEFEQIKNNKDFVIQKQKLDSIYSDIFQKHKAFSEKFILENPGSLVNLMALDQQLGRSAPVFEMKKDFRIFEMVDSSLSEKYPSLEIVKNLNRKVVMAREHVKLQPGAVIPDIALPDTSGNIIKLSSLRGKYVVLSFWASWSAKCREQSKILQKMVQKYPAGQFEVYQVSLDKTKESWETGLKEDKCNWINVSDLKYLDSDLINKFLLNGIPFYYLIQKDGQIMLKGDNLSDIETKLNEIF